MRFPTLATVAVVALTADVALASTWLSKAVYNKWHETELERWLSDHNVPYPTPADRKDLENLVKDNWNAYVIQPYSSWDTNQLQKWISAQSQDTKKAAAKNKDSLVQQVQATWTETTDSADKAYADVKDWIFGSWSESQLKAFLDRHGIPNPQPTTKDSLLAQARENYQTIANQLGQTTFYPGNWLYESWAESDLKAWCDERGIQVPQPSSRDKLIATVRRNARIASQQFAALSSAAAASAAAATQSLSDALLDAWSDSQIKEWCDKNGIKVPQGSRRNELVALARRNWAKVYGGNTVASASSLYGAATSNANNQFAKATDDASLYANELYAQALDYFDWATSQLGFAAASGTASAKALSASVSSAASSASVSASKAAAKAGKKDAQKIGDAAAQSVSKLKHRAEESWQKATDKVKEL